MQEEGQINRIKSFDQIDKTLFPEQAESTFHEKLSRVGIEDNYGYANREIFQEGREKTDLINKPESGSIEEENKKSRELTSEFEKAIKWTDTYLSDEVVDKYALSYVKNQKNPEEKRQNKKYGKYLTIANNELKPRLAELLEQKIKDKAIDSKESDPNIIKNEIAKILNSEMHATLLLRVLSNFDAENLAKEERDRNDFGEKATFLVGDEVPGEKIRKKAIGRHFSAETPENSGTTKTLEVPRAEEDQLDREMKEGYSILIKEEKSTPTPDSNQLPEQESEPLLEVNLESVIKPEPKEEIEETKLKDEITEAPKTEKDFFKKFEQFGSYFNPTDNSEFQILGYDSEKKEVAIYRHRSFVYDKATDSWEAPEERGKEEILKYEDFLKFAGEHISDLTLNHEYFKEDKMEMEKEKTKEREKTEGLYVNDDGNYFRQEEYIKNEGEKKHTSKEGELVLYADPKIRKEFKRVTTSQLKDLVNKGRLNFYRNEDDLLKAFEKEFGEFEDEKNTILNFKYWPEKGQYLAQIKEKDQEPRLVSVKELREILKNLSTKKPEEKIDNAIEKLNELEEKLVDIFRGEVLEYEKKAEKWVREIFSEELLDINKKDLIIKWVDKTLSGLINEALKKNNIKNASVEKVINKLKSEITPSDELAEKIKNDINSLLEKI